MTTGSRIILFGFLIIVVPFVGLFFLALGPMGWMTIGGLVVLLGLVVTAMEDGDGAPDRTNCSACGAPNDPENAQCEYCGDDL